MKHKRKRWEGSERERGVNVIIERGEAGQRGKKWGAAFQPSYLAASLIVGASGYSTPFRRSFCFDWFLLWASDRLICQKAQSRAHMSGEAALIKSTPPLYVGVFLFFFISLIYLFFFIALLLPLVPLFVTVQYFFCLCVYNYPACIGGPAPGLPSASFVPLPPCVSFVFVFSFIK